MALDVPMGETIARIIPTTDTSTKIGFISLLLWVGLLLAALTSIDSLMTNHKAEVIPAALDHIEIQSRNIVTATHVTFEVGYILKTSWLRRRVRDISHQNHKTILSRGRNLVR